jgi:hypothetical protein
MKLNGIELTAKEELNLLRREIRMLKHTILTADYREGANAVDKSRFLYKRTAVIKAKLLIDKLRQKRDITRNRRDFEILDKKIDKLRVIIKNYEK